MGQPGHPRALAQLLDAVDDMAPVLRDCSLEAERERRLPQRAVDAMLDAGLFRCAAPEAVGGLELGPLAQIEVFESVTAIDGAAGWNLTIGAIGTALIGTRLDDSAAEQIFAGPKWPIVAGLVWPRGKAVPVDGGFTVNGRWSFGSGIHQAAWVMGGVLTLHDGKPVLGKDGVPQASIAVFPRSEVTVLDNWHVAGLRGTGSCDYSVESLFVPEAFVFQALTPSVRRGGPWLSLPGPVLVSPGHAGFALGIARGVLRELESAVAAARRSFIPSQTGERESFQLALGRHSTAYDAARTLVMEAHRDLWETSSRGDAPSVNQVGRMRTCVVYATEIAVEIAQFAYRAAGTAALFESNPLQRALRDILAAQQHTAVRDTHYVDMAKARIESAASSPSLA